MLQTSFAPDSKVGTITTNFRDVLLLTLYIVRYPMTDLQEGLLLLAGVCVQAIDIKTVRIPRAAADTE